MKKQTRDDLMGLGFMFLLLMTAIGIRAYICFNSSRNSI